MIAPLVLLAALPSPYETRLELDLTLAASAAAFVLTTELLKGQLVQPGCSCRLEELPMIDRATVGPYDRRVGITSDVSIALVLAAPFVLSAFDAHGFRDWMKDAAVLAETLAMTLTLNQIVKFAVQRPRPYVYAGTASGDASGDALLSFYSMHSSTAFAMMNALGLTYARRHPSGPLRYVVFIVGNLLAAAVATMRVGAHMHFVTDVLVGGAIGAAIGLLVPLAHLRLGYSW